MTRSVGRQAAAKRELEAAAAGAKIAHCKWQARVTEHTRGKIKEKEKKEK
jgi:hypothetical protein